MVILFLFNAKTQQNFYRCIIVTDPSGGIKAMAYVRAEQRFC